MYNMIGGSEQIHQWRGELKILNKYIRHRSRPLHIHNSFKLTIDRRNNYLFNYMKTIKKIDYSINKQMTKG